MVLSKKQWLVIGSIASAVAIALVVGITVGVVVSRRKSTIVSVEQRAHDILARYPLIDG
jgi:uncharacterized membrane-anchored protein YhcB (DUF1043 family)